MSKKLKPNLVSNNVALLTKQAKSESGKKYPDAVSMTSHNITVSAQVQFLPEHSDKDQNHYVWAYHITIENHRTENVQLIKRHWQILDEKGNCDEVTGFGVVGEQPVLAPKQIYRYSSGCPLACQSGMMIGKYQMSTASGQILDITIPALNLEIPGGNKIIH